MTNPRIIIEIEGGIIQHVYADTEADIRIIDHDYGDDDPNLLNLTAGAVPPKPPIFSNPKNKNLAPA